MNRIFGSALGVGVIVFIVVIALSFLLKSNGFHIQQFKIVRGGNIAITAPQMGVDIFLNQKKISTTKENERELTLVKNLAPGVHSVLIFNEEGWPWKKDITVRSGETLSLNPFIVKKNASGVIVTNRDPEYSSLRFGVRNSPLPTYEKPKTSVDGHINIWAEGNSVFALWTGDIDTLPDFFCDDQNNCDKKVEVLSATDSIRSLDFYKEKNNILLVAFSNGIFAIEIDKRGGTQNFQPLYKGTELPLFEKVDTDTLNILDGSAIFIINS